MTLEEARETFLNRGWIKAEGGTYFDGDKWREAVMVISDYLQKEQCEDLISRQAAIDAIERNAYRHTYIDQIVDIIKGLPSAQPEQRWIPCSERLPEEYGEFLVTMTEKAKAKDLGFDIDETYIRKMRYNSNGWQFPRHIPSWINEAVKDEVLAWMPLPEPYKGGEQDG